MRRISLLIITGLVSAFPVHSQELNLAVVEKVKAALPDKPTVTPKAQRSMLVFTLCTGFKHASIPVAAKALELLGENTGAFRTVVSEDPQMFRPENLAHFDAVCLDNTTGSPLAQLPQLNL